jgi:class 3 adenylate cyclase/tetratricopeptide (TPR) repeat protein
VRCPKCETENLADSTFCIECGAKLEAVCASCGTESPPGAKFCRRCGERLGEVTREPGTYTPEHIADKILSSKASTEGERKQVTVLFADVTGSMDLQEQVDPEAWRDIMNRFFHLMCEGIHRFEGTVNKFTGDGIMALFGAPIAHEDHAQRACYAALAISGKLNEYAHELRREQGLSFHVRMGINSGEVVFGAIGDDLRMDFTALGHTVGLAARMESLAEPGSVYLTEHTASLAEGYFDLADLGPFTVKGVRDPVGVYALRGLGTIRTRFELSRARGFSRFVGRTAEQEVLESALDRAMNGEGAVVAIVAEAGVGKSRLCYEFAERCSAKGISVRRASGVAHGRSIPYLPVLELMRDFFNITDTDTAQQTREKVAGKLLLLDRTLEDALPLLFEFLGVPDSQRPPPRMSPEARQRQLFGIIRHIVQARSRKDMVVLILEDLHWIDSGTQVFLDALVETLPGTHALVVANFRPEYHATWMQAPHYRGVALKPLGAEDTDEMLHELVGDDPSLADLAAKIADRTAGNPFFIEEVVRTLVESGSLEGQKGRYRIAHAVDAVAIPATVEAVLAARIDRLDEDQKDILQTASVIGREFPESVLAKLLDADETRLAKVLQDLVESEFLYEAALYPEAEFAFRHPLTQEVAYRSQLGERRTKVHAAVAHAILALYPEKLDERAALLAHHFEAGGQALEAAQWRMAAAAWVGRSDHAEAREHLRRARASLETLPPGPVSEGMLLAVLAQLLYHGWRIGMDREEASEVYTRARALAEANGDSVTAVIVTATYAAVLAISGAIPDAIAYSREAWSIFREFGGADSPLRFVLMVNLVYFQFVAGEWAEALALLNEVLADPPDDPTIGIDITGFSPYIWLHGMSGYIGAFSGAVPSALEKIEGALEMARAHGDAELEGWMHGAVSGVASVSGDASVLGTHGASAIEIAERIGSQFSRALAYENVGQALFVRGEWAAAAETVESALDTARRHHVAVEQTPFMLALLAEAYLELGDERASARAEEAAAEAKRLGAMAAMPRSIIAMARCRGRSGDPADIQQAMRMVDEAQGIAERMGAAGWIPDHYLARAEIAANAGDDEARREALREAARRFASIGAHANAAKVEALLA